MVVCSFWHDQWQKTNKGSIMNLKNHLGFIIGFWKSPDWIDNFMA